MSIEFTMPNIGEGVDSADIAEILVAEGDTIQTDQVVCELETDKAVVELPCPHAGVIEKLHISEGDTIQVGQVLLTITPSDGAAVSSQAAPAQSAQHAQDSSPAPQPPAETPPTVAVDETPGDTPTESSPDEIEQFEFVLPNIGEGVETADIAEIHVAEGDTVTAHQTVMDLETDKAVVELPCPVGGTITSLHVTNGATIRVGQKLLTIAVKGSRHKPGVPSEPPASSAATTPKRESPPIQADAGRTRGPAVRDAFPTRETRTVVISGRVTSVTATDSNGREGDQYPPVAAAPSTRRLARQLGVDLRQVGGSGRGGRITREDVQEYVKGRLTGNLPAFPATGGLTTLAPGSIAPPPLPDFTKFGPVQREKLNKIARTAAENLTVSWNVIPHVTQHDRADITDLEAARKRFAEGVGQKGPKVTMTAIVMKALAICLQQYPKFNSSLDPETQELVYKQYYHLGCAVDTPHGLLVPVVKDTQSKSIREIAREVAEMAELARERKLPIDAMQGATCTVTNLGGIGGVGFTPIVNYPEVCILGMARGQKELRLDGERVVERLMLPLSLSYDHRVINGADAARFMVSLCDLLSDPFQLLSAI